MARKLPTNRRQCQALIIHPPWFRLQDSNLVPFPAGPCAVAATLERGGIGTLVWNGDFDGRPTMSVGGTHIFNTSEMALAHERYLARLNDMDDPVWREVLAIITATTPEVVGISAYSVTFRSAANVATIIRQHYPGIRIVLGGMHGTIAPRDCLEECPAIDVVVRGEAEFSAVPLFRALLDRAPAESLSIIPGLAFRSTEGIVVTADPGHVEDLDALPYPARHLLVDLDRMPPSAHQAIYGFRGCPFQCIFCGSFNIFGRKPRMRSALSIVDEMESVHRTYGTSYFFICDDIFLLDRARVLEFCDLLERRNLSIYYSLQSRGELMDNELLARMKATGCQHIAVGVEVGDEGIRKLIKKGNTVEEMRRAAQLIRDNGLRMSGFFMFGFPWETREQMMATVTLMEELNPFVAFPYIVTPSPGTELLEIAQGMNLMDAAVDLSSFAHVSPKMGLSAHVPEQERASLIDGILERFARHNRRSLRGDLLRRPRFFWRAARDAGILSSFSSIVGYVRIVVGV